MITLPTCISYGYISLLNTFVKANNLTVTCTETDRHPVNTITLEYEDNSPTAYDLTFMSLRHLGIENMLCDYLIRCGVNPNMISVGRVFENRDMKQVEEGWQQHRKTLGFY